MSGTTDVAGSRPSGQRWRRQIGPIGATARVVLGLVLVAGGVTGWEVEIGGGRIQTGFEPISLFVGALVLPAVMITWQWLRARRTESRLEATGPAGTALNMLVFAALFLTPWYLPPLSFTSNAALILYGGSMVLAAVRGYGGCEVLAISNWILSRDDQIWLPGVQRGGRSRGRLEGASMNQSKRPQNRTNVWKAGDGLQAPSGKTQIEFTYRLITAR